MAKKRAIIMIIDACGIGSMPDWADYDEVAPANTLRVYVSMLLIS